MKTESNAKTWETTPLQNLVRHKSGRYYARFYLNGKEIWKSLKTSHFSVAEARLAVAIKEHRERKSKHLHATNAKMTFGQAAALHMDGIKQNVSLKRRTRVYWQEISNALTKSWPDLAEKELRRVTILACREWAVGYAEGASSSRYNHTLSFLNHVFKLGIDNGIIYSSPASGLKRKPVRPKPLELPTRAQFAQFITEIQGGHKSDSQNCADLAQGLAFTGCRISEANQIEWGDLNFDAGEIAVKGDPEENTKNGDFRYVPMIPEARRLFEKMRQQRPEERKNAKVFLVRECQKSMNRAAKEVKMPRVTHHDLRHFFATVCIESGVDIPTVSRWLGHKDGGVLAMKTYGHLRREHSVAAALKVSFQPLAA